MCNPRQPLDDLREPGLGLVAEPGAGEHEVEMDPLEQAPLLVVEPERLAARVQLIDPGEQLRIEVDRAFVRGELRRHLALDSLQRRRRLGRREVEEHLLDPHQAPAAAVERNHRVLERRRVRVRGDRRDLLGVLADRGLERRREVRCLDAVEGRKLERRIPRLQQGIGGLEHRRSLSNASSARRIPRSPDHATSTHRTDG